MVFLFKSPASAVWIVLMLATCASTWWLSKDSISATIATVMIMIIAAIKVRLIMMHFMELNRAPMQWRLLFDGWIVVSTSIIVGVYLR